MVDDGGNTEQGRGAPQVLQVPEEEGEDKTDAESHKPGYVEEGAVAKVGESAKDGQPFRQLSCCLREYSALEKRINYVSREIIYTIIKK